MEEEDDEDALVILPPAQRPNSATMRSALRRELLGESLKRRKGRGLMSASDFTASQLSQDLRRSSQAHAMEEGVEAKTEADGVCSNDEDILEESSGSESKSVEVERTFGAGREMMEGETSEEMEEKEQQEEKEGAYGQDAPKIYVEEEASVEGEESREDEDEDEDEDEEDLDLDEEVENLIDDEGVGGEEEEGEGRSLYRAFDQREDRKVEAEGEGDGDEECRSVGSACGTKLGVDGFLSGGYHARRATDSGVFAFQPPRLFSNEEVEEGEDEESRMRAKALWRAEKRRRMLKRGEEITFCNLDCDSKTTWERLQKRRTAMLSKVRFMTIVVLSFPVSPRSPP